MGSRPPEDDAAYEERLAEITIGPPAPLQGANHEPWAGIVVAPQGDPLAIPSASLVAATKKSGDIPQLLPRPLLLVERLRDGGAAGSEILNAAPPTPDGRRLERQRYEACVETGPGNPMKSQRNTTGPKVP